MRHGHAERDIGCLMFSILFKFQSAITSPLCVDSPPVVATVGEDMSDERHDTSLHGTNNVQHLFVECPAIPITTPAIQHQLTDWQIDSLLY